MFIIWSLCSISLYSSIYLLIGLIVKGNIDTNSLAFYLSIIYPLTLTFDIIWKKSYRKKNKFIFEEDSNKSIVLMFHSIFESLVKPFEWVYMYVLIITKKHTIQDDSKFHNVMDLLEIWINFFVVLFIIYIAFVYFT